MIAKENWTREIKAKAAALGFDGITIAKAEYMDEEARHLQAWLDQGLHGGMDYMTEHFDKRVDPTRLVPGAQSVISLMYNYHTEEVQKDPLAPKIASYAYGKDYHRVVKKQLVKLLKWMKKEIGDITVRYFVDSGPILERDWAKRSGMGWTGKHTLLINKQKGSYFFLAEIVTDIELDYEGPTADHCGTCTRCIDACPTDAISAEGYLVDASKCISYLTIEHKGGIPEDFSGKMADYIYGCDICQQVCPWNKFASPHANPALAAKEAVINLTKQDWEDLTSEAFEKLFIGSPLKRAQYEGIKRNIKFLDQ